MRPGVAADGVAGGGDLLEDAGLIGGVLADREEDRLGAVRRHRVHHGHGALRPRAIVEGQHHFAGTQEIVFPEMFEAEAGAAGGVDLDHARNAKRIGIAWAGCAGGSGRRRRRRPAASLTLLAVERLVRAAIGGEAGGALGAAAAWDVVERCATVAGDCRTLFNLTDNDCRRACGRCRSIRCGGRLGCGCLLASRKPKTPRHNAMTTAQAVTARRMALSQPLRRYLPGERRLNH